MKATFSDWGEIKQQREFRAILALCQGSDHLVRVYEILRESDSKFYFVCEFMPNGDLKDFLGQYRKQGKFLEPSLVRSIVQQVMFGLQHIHSHGFMHRDLKPENLLMSGTTCKVADFSLARIASLNNDDQRGRMTTYVSSRWYRAPELVLEAPVYTTAVDIFALGCIMSELFSLRPLFPGKNEHDQLPVLLKLLGPLQEEVWPEGARLLERLQVNFPRTTNSQLQDNEIPVSQRLADKLGLADSDTIWLVETQPER